jgi:cytochrome P450
VPGDWLVGNMFRYLRDPLTYLTRASRQYGDVVRSRLGPYNDYLISHPDLIEYVLRVHQENYIKDKVTQMLRPLVGNGLLTSEGPFWRRQRKLAQPGFQQSQVQAYAATMVDLAGRMLQSWESGRDVEVHGEMSRLTLAIVVRCLFSADVGDAAEVVGRSLDTIMGRFLDPSMWFPIRDHLPLPSTLRYKDAIRRIDEVVYGIIRKRRESKDDPGDLLSRLLAAQDDEGQGMTDKQLRDEVVTLFLAGHETTALALTYALHLLARHPEADARLGAELAEVLDGDRPPNVGDVPRLTYTEWVVREAMRLYPPAWGIGREALHHDEVGGYFIPRGTQISVSMWVTHRDPRWYERPEEFRPERWAGDFIRQLPRGAYMPFGGGPRVCVGNHFAMMELVLVLATLARRYRFELADDPELEVVPSITLRPKGPVMLRPVARR